MLRRILLSLTLVLVLSGFFASKAQAQYLEEDPKSYIKRGFFMSASYGLYVFALRPDGLAGGENAPSASLVGTLGAIEIGYDIADVFSLQFSFMIPAVSGDPQFGGGNTDCLFQLGATINFVRLDQLFIYAKLGAGVSLSLPNPEGNLGLITHLGLGIRYYTRARHLSIGIEVIGLLRPIVFNATSAGSNVLSLGIGVLPSLIYSF